MKTFSSIGKGTSSLDGHQEATLLEHTGTGCLTHMWFGGDWEGYGKTRIRVYVDGEATASIDMELALGHGDGFGTPGPWGGPRMGKTGVSGGIYNTFRIPYGKHIRVTGQRSAEGPAASPFWWILRGTDGLQASLGGVDLPKNARLKLYGVHNHDAEPLEEVVLCEAKRNGALYQVTIAAQGLNRKEDWHALSYMEACIRAYVGESATPMLLSSGLEDYFLGTYYFQRGAYSHDLAGLTHMDANTQSFSAYRFHDEDPIFFTDGLRLTCRCGETEHGTLEGPAYGDPPRTRYRTYAWVYEW
ncbi:MAG: DUF2961 domain-containing protein [Fimbriimonas sp.]